MKVVVNRDYGGFSLSGKGLAEYNRRAGTTLEYDYDIKRDDIHLVATIEALGVEAAGRFATLEVVDIPDDVEWEIEQYDGNEWVAEKHRIW